MSKRDRIVFSSFDNANDQVQAVQQNRFQALNQLVDLQPLIHMHFTPTPHAQPDAASLLEGFTKYDI